jgi:hypothetical protein
MKHVSHSTSTSRHDGLWSRGHTVRIAGLALLVGLALAGCGVVQGRVFVSSTSPTGFPDVNLSVRPCAIQTIGLLTPAQLPAHLTPEWPASSEAGTIGPYYDLGGGGPVYPGSIGDANEYFQWTGFTTHPLEDLPSNGPMYATHPTQVFQLAEEVDDWGTVTNAKRWMASQRVNQGDIVRSLGDDTFMYHANEGEANDAPPYTDANPGDVFTDIEVREGDTMFALSIDAGPAADPESLAVSIMRSLMAKERAVCG